VRPAFFKEIPQLVMNVDRIQERDRTAPFHGFPPVGGHDWVVVDFSGLRANALGP